MFVCALMSGVFLTVYAAAPPAKLSSFWDHHQKDNNLVLDHSSWQQILDNYVDDQHQSGINRFDYLTVNEQSLNNLDDYLGYLQSIDPRELNPDEQLAFWINLYNAMTVSIIAREKNLKGVANIVAPGSGFLKRGSGLWNRKLVKIVGKRLSLNDIEHSIIRPIWHDVRVLYVLNRASLGGANFLKTVFSSSNIEPLLQKASIQYVNHPRAVEIKGNELHLSNIYSWYGRDFGKELSAILEHIKLYAKPGLIDQLQEFSAVEYHYNWSLNKP